jgi:hypothetical protein
MLLRQFADADEARPGTWGRLCAADRLAVGGELQEPLEVGRVCAAGPMRQAAAAHRAFLAVRQVDEANPGSAGQRAQLRVAARAAPDATPRQPRVKGGGWPRGIVMHNWIVTLVCGRCNSWRQAPVLVAARVACGFRGDSMSPAPGV